MGSKFVGNSQNSAFHKNYVDTISNEDKGKKRRRHENENSYCSREDEDARSVTILPDTPLTIVFESGVDSKTPVNGLFDDHDRDHITTVGRRRLVFSPIIPAPSSYHTPNLRKNQKSNQNDSIKGGSIAVPLPVFKEIRPLAAQRKNLYMSMKKRKKGNIVRRSERISDAVERDDDE